MKSHSFALVAVLSLLAGCATDAERETLDRARDEAERTPRIEDHGDDACMVEECFLLTADKDISFIAVEGRGCDGRALELSLWTTDDERIDVEPVEHGQGTSCTGVSSDALKLEGFEGHESREYRLCVATRGSMTLPDLRVTTKAGRMCETFTHVGDCQSCGGGDSTETTTSSSSSTSGAGGADTETTVSVTATVGVTASVGTGAGGADTETTSATTGGGEGGCGGASGEGGAATDVTATAGVTTGGGEGGAGQGGMGEGGACDGDTDVEVDTVD